MTQATIDQKALDHELNYNLKSMKAKCEIGELMNKLWTNKKNI